jgi:hypothetical protein
MVRSHVDVSRKSGVVVPIPFLMNVKKRRQYNDVFSHYGWVFATDSGLSFLVFPSVIILDSHGMLSSDQYIKLYCAEPKVERLEYNYSEIGEPFLVENVIPKNKIVRVPTLGANLDIMIYESDKLNILNSIIGNHKTLEISSLVFKPSWTSSLDFPYIKKDLQKGFIKQVSTLKVKK